MKGCLLIVLGAIVGAVALSLFLAFWPVSSKSGYGKTASSPDVEVTIYEPYLNRLADESLDQDLKGKVSATSVDIKPGNKVIVSLETRLSDVDLGTGLLGTVASALEKVKKGAITLRISLRASVAGGKLQFRVEEIRIGKLPVQRRLLVGPLGSVISSMEQQINGEINARLKGASFTPVGIESDEDSLTVYLDGD